ncbi:hypothetical protein [Flavobacterium kingsejongi]|uniref:Uncharacterized protein n=1 Tax=Flavobacterium kingsejongi TaxID=1678728 RepID=A0A2S1LSW4_9FLAO|nr:hypothetical protein [Flavobacterium kingsejongi]AWG26850.1 hypothetical protein FK004_17250 [Flavobacterium kingsejongi]
MQTFSHSTLEMGSYIRLQKTWSNALIRHPLPVPDLALLRHLQGKTDALVKEIRIPRPVLL